MMEVREKKQKRKMEKMQLAEEIQQGPGNSYLLSTTKQAYAGSSSDLHTGISSDRVFRFTGARRRKDSTKNFPVRRRADIHCSNFSFNNQKFKPGRSYSIAADKTSPEARLKIQQKDVQYASVKRFRDKVGKYPQSWNNARKGDVQTELKSDQDFCRTSCKRKDKKEQHTKHKIKPQVPEICCKHDIMVSDNQEGDTDSKVYQKTFRGKKNSFQSIHHSSRDDSNTSSDSRSRNFILGSQADCGAITKGACEGLRQGSHKGFNRFGYRDNDESRRNRSGLHKLNPRRHNNKNRHDQQRQRPRPQCTVTSMSYSEGNRDQPQGSVDKSDIPGFYFDPQKKRYFKIVNCASNVDGDIITKESIAKIKAETQRQNDLQSVTSERTIRKFCNHSVSSLLLKDYQRGEVNVFKLRRAWILNSASSLRHTACHRVFSAPEFHENLEHMLQMEMSKDHKKLLCLWSVEGTVMQRLQLVSVEQNKKTWPGELALKFDSSDTTVLQSWNKITNICWADFSQCPEKTYVLYTTVCHTGQMQSLAFIRNLDPATQDMVHFLNFNLGTGMSWTCAWNYHRQQFSVGTEKGCLLVDVNTRQLWQFKTNNSDALTQIFSKEDGGNFMYTGTRNGCILKHDLRSVSTLPVGLMNHHSSVCCLRLSPDENYLYASDFNGKIKKWDLRMKKVVLNYEGLFNKYSKLPFYVDESQSVLYAAGQDCYTKIWCLNRGTLMHSIPPPFEASLSLMPTVQFSTRWAGVDGNIGLIMGALKSFYVYGSGFQSKED